MRILIIISIFFIYLQAGSRLAAEESFYLRMHADNPVDWYSWSDEAFKKAKRENKLIFLSIGYSTCHWCHVMERESFENREIAELLNRDFVAIKVDKEERPDIDRFYQKVHHTLREQGGGWPLTVILTPNMKPIFTATYIPPEDRYNRKGLKSILPIIVSEYRKSPKKFESFGDELLKFIKKVDSSKIAPQQIELKLLSEVKSELKSRFDSKFGGFGNAPKFPQEALLNLLIDSYKLTGDKMFLNMLNRTLRGMAQSGLYDMVEGGFFRYSTSRDFSTPHFEKMLYSNANLIEVYSRAYLISPKPLYRKVITQTVDFIDSRFQKDGLYFSATDADSSGGEGRYYTYIFYDTLKELIKRGFDKERVIRELERLNIRVDGNVEGELNLPILKEGIDLDVVDALKSIREDREFPFIDKKILTSWNSMYIGAKLYASLIEPKFRDSALNSLNRLLSELYIGGVLYHQKLLGREPKVKAFLEDYSYLIKALIVANQITLDDRYLKIANKLYREAQERFYKEGRWLFSTEIEGFASIEDNSYPSPLAILFMDMLSLATLNGDLKLYERTKEDMKRFSGLIGRSPSYYPTLLRANLRVEAGDVVVKSKKGNLTPINRFHRLNYPYIFLKVIENGRFLLCKIDRCFKSLKRFDEVKSLLNSKEVD